MRPKANKHWYIVDGIYIEVCKLGAFCNYRHKFKAVQLEFQEIRDIFLWKYFSRRIAKIYMI